MAYVRIPDDDSTAGWLGCGPSCRCSNCRQTAGAIAGLDEYYVPEEREEIAPMPALRIPRVPRPPSNLANLGRFGEPLWQARTLPPHGGFFGALGEKPAPTEIGRFLDQVRQQPQYYGGLLLTVTFHPDFNSSQYLWKVPFTVGGRRKFIIDMMIMSGVSEADVYNELKRISDDFKKRNPEYRREADAELQLRNDIMKTAGALGPDRLKPFSVEPLMPYDQPEGWKFRQLGRDFARAALPPALQQRIINSRAWEAHQTYLGAFLRRYGEMLEKRDQAFKAQVDRQRQIRQQIIQQQQKPKQQQQRRRP